MAHWDKDKNKIVYSTPKPHPNYQDWVLMDCGCCMGFQWGQEGPVECNRCLGGSFALHVQSGIGAKYPGGPLNGYTFTVEAAQRILEQANARQRA